MPTNFQDLNFVFAIVRGWQAQSHDLRKIIRVNLVTRVKNSGKILNSSLSHIKDTKKCRQRTEFPFSHREGKKST